MNFFTDLQRKILFFIPILIVMSALSAMPPKVVVKMATLAPEGSDWHALLLEMGQEWEKATDGRISLRLYPGGVVGDERDMVRKMRIGQIHAAAVTTEGLSELTSDVNAFYIPGLFQSYEDAEFIRNALSPELEKGIYESGFKLLLWADVGWAYWFTKKPVFDPDDLKSMKIFTWAGDYKSASLWKKAGFNPVPLASVDVLSGLQTGLVDAFSTTPMVALSMQWFGLAPNMLDLKWGLMVAGIVIDNRTWNKITDEDKETVLKICKKVALKHQENTRQKDADAIKVMEGYGLKINRISPGEVDDWVTFLESWYPHIRGFLVPEAIFDKTIELKKELDSNKANGTKTDQK